MADDLTLLVRNRAISGWDTIRVTRGVERMPSDFTLTMTERYPGELDFITQPGDTCQVEISGDLVITGYVDRVIPEIGPGRHIVTVMGRGKCCDLVDCSAEWPGYQISATNALDIAEKLAEPYGISAVNLSDAGPRIPQFNLNPGETAYSVIEKVCRFAALLVHEGTDGNLILSRIGAKQAASGFKEGVNVQSAKAPRTMDERYSEYDCMIQSIATLQDVGRGGFVQAKAYDKGVPRHRKLLLITESGAAGQEITRLRVQWENARRYGRSRAVHLVTDSWRDSAGNLYEPNMLVDLSLPTLKLDGVTWVIGEVTYQLDETEGTTCELEIMPQEAFLPQPQLLQPLTPDVPANAGLNTK